MNGKVLTCLFSLSVSLIGVAAKADSTLGYNEVTAAYTANPKAAAKKYGNKRLAFRGTIMRLGSDPGGTLFGAVTEDGAKFDLSFRVEDQDTVKNKFPNGEIKEFTASSPLVFECLNGGFLKGAIVPSIKLTDCRGIK